MFSDLKIGVYFSANDIVYDWAIAFLNSFRKFNPDLRLILIPFNDRCDRLLQLQDKYKFEVYIDPSFDRLEAIGQAFELGHTPTGPYWFRRYAAFWGSLDRFLYLDARQVILADLTPFLTALDEFSFDFLYYDCAIAQGMQDNDAFVGVVNNFYENDREVKILPQNITSKGLLTGFNTTDFPSPKDTVYHQPGFWFNTKYLKEIGFLNEELNLQFDFDRVVRYVHHHPNVNYSDRVLVNFRCHQEQKTAPANVKQEGQCIANSILADLEYQDLHQPAKLWLERLIWYEYLTTISQRQGTPRIVKALKLLLLSCANPQAYWTRYTFGGIRKLLVE